MPMLPLLRTMAGSHCHRRVLHWRSLKLIQIEPYVSLIDAVNPIPL